MVEPGLERSVRQKFREPGVHGAVLTEALASRFAAQIQVSTDYDLARALKIDPRAVRAARNLATRQASGEIGWAPYAEPRIMSTSANTELAVPHANLT
jgi:hypothetical protein